MSTATIAPQQQAVLDVLATHVLAPKDTVNVHPNPTGRSGGYANGCGKKVLG